MRRRSLLNKGTAYLRVYPETVQWVDVNLPADYNIESNRNWIVQ